MSTTIGSCRALESLFSSQWTSSGYFIIHANTARRRSLNTIDHWHLPVGERLSPQLGHIEETAPAGSRGGAEVVELPVISRPRNEPYDPDSTFAALHLFEVLAVLFGLMLA